jgi:hypothetical protein
LDSLSRFPWLSSCLPFHALLLPFIYSSNKHVLNIYTALTTVGNSVW